MDNVRRSFSNMKKDFKRRLGGKKRALDRAGADTAGDRANSSVSVLRPDSLVAASSHNEEGTTVGTNISQARSRDLSPMPAGEGRPDNSQRKEADVDEKERDQRDSRPDQDVEVVAGSGPGREDKRAYSPQPVTLVSPNQQPDGTWTHSPQLMCLIIPLRHADASAVPEKELLHDDNTESDLATNEKKSSWKATTFATAKLLLRGVRGSADAFGPLKSVAGSLCFILENCEVRSSLHIHRQSSNRYPSG